MCVRYIGTKCQSQKVALSAPKKINCRKYTPRHKTKTKESNGDYYIWSVYIYKDLIEMLTK